MHFSHGFVPFMLLVFGCSQYVTAPQANVASPRGRVGNITLGQDSMLQQAVHKVIVAQLAFSSDGVELSEFLIEPGDIGNSSDTARDFTVSVIDRSGETIFQRSIWDPRVVFVEGYGLLNNERAIYTARLPYKETVSFILVTDKWGRVVLNWDLARRPRRPR
jgi:hypothetical protein